MIDDMTEDVRLEHAVELHLASGDLLQPHGSATRSPFGRFRGESFEDELHTKMLQRYFEEFNFDTRLREVVFSLAQQRLEDPVGFVVQQLRVDASASASAKPDDLLAAPKEHAEPKEHASDYFNSTGFRELLLAAIDDVALRKPADPFAHMADFMAHLPSS